jgi:hypothetical protein
MQRTPISKNTTFDIEAQSFDIVCRHRRRIQVYRYREIFDIGIYRYRSFGRRYRRFFDIVMSRYRSKMLRYREFFDVVMDRYRMFLHSICFCIRYRCFQDLEHSISNVKTFDIEFNIVSRYRRSFSDARYRQYRNIPISKVQRSISNVAKVPDGRWVTVTVTVTPWLAGPGLRTAGVTGPSGRRPAARRVPTGPSSSCPG